MLDLNFVRENYEHVRAALVARKFPTASSRNPTNSTPSATPRAAKSAR